LSCLLLPPYPAPPYLAIANIKYSSTPSQITMKHAQKAYFPQLLLHNELFPAFNKKLKSILQGEKNHLKNIGKYQYSIQV
jgi:hypothetical protein